MEIVLKTGEKITLEVSSLVLEYLEEYDGGIEQLKKDAKGEKDEYGYSKLMYVTNHMLYSIIASNYNSELTPKQAIRLVKLEDVPKIIEFLYEYLQKLELESESESNNKVTRQKRIHRI